MDKVLKILCGAGGTGGHLFPALAVIEQLEKLYGNIEVHFAGRADKIEGEKIPKLGYKFHPMNIRGIQKLASLSNLAIPFEIRKSVNEMRQLIQSEKIDFVICTGSYISYPPGKAAIKETTPLFLMESNVNPGKSLKMLSAKATRIFTSFESSSRYFKNLEGNRVQYIGNPVRQSIIDMPDKNSARAKLGYAENDKIVFIFGGSLGSKSINEAVDHSIEQFEENNFKLIWQTGKLYEPTSVLPSNINQSKFIDDMAINYAAADLIVSRSGATTISELTVAGKPAILVPLESASNNEQELNALEMQKIGAAKMIKNNELKNNLFDLIHDLINDKELLNHMASNSKKIAQPKAAENTAKEIMNFLNLQYEK